MNWLLRLFRTRKLERELDAELRFHFESQVQGKVEAGMSSSEARRTTRLEFGGLEQIKEQCRETRGTLWPASLAQDFRFALRSLNKTRSFTFLAVLSLSLGIGSVTVIFSAIYGVLIHPFPYPHFDRLVNFMIASKDESGGGRGFLTIPEFLDYREQNHVFVDMIGGDTVALHYRFGNGSLQWNVSRASPNQWTVLGAKALLGRIITPDDTRAGAPPVFMMAYRVWKTQFNSDPDIIGKTFDISDVPCRLIGVLEPRFSPGNGADAFMGFSMDRVAVANDPTFKDARVWPLGMLKPGITIPQAAADLDLVAHHLAKVYPRDYPAQFRITAVSLLDLVLPRFRQMLYPLLGAVLLLLLIACGNVANLLLSRATVRDREIAVRSSLGGSRWRLIRQLLVESFVLACAGCMAGCVFAWLGIRELVPLIPQRAVPDESIIEINWIVLLATMGLAFLATILCGLLPAIQSVSGPLYPRLAASGKGSSVGLHHARSRSFLIIVEVALSVVLLTGAGLMLRTFFATTHRGLAFEPRSILSLQLRFPPGTYDKPAERKVFFDELQRKLTKIPGVRDATEAIVAGPAFYPSSPIDREGSTHAEPWRSSLNAVGADFFRIFGYNLLRGRLFDRDDFDGPHLVVVVNQAFARQFLSKGDPLGQQVNFAFYDEIKDLPSHSAAPVSDKSPKLKSYFEVVGVISDSNAGLTADQLAPEAFLPSTVLGQIVGGLAVKASGDAEQVAGPVIQQVWAMNRNLDIGEDRGSIYDVFQKYVYAQPKFEFVMLSTFAGIGLLLVVIGIYSVTAYNVSLQTREIGIRMALGAQRGDVLRSILRHGGIIIGMGLLLGLFAAWGTTRLIKNQLFGVEPTDPWTFAVVVATIFAVGMFACFLPGRRAIRIDPCTALRHD